nr:MAG TPA: hypothetical protein [Crassvirales sp.]
MHLYRSLGEHIVRCECTKLVHKLICNLMIIKML